MSLEVIVAVVGTVAAVAVSQWPRIAPLLRRSPKPPSAVDGPAAAAPTFLTALECLSVVRLRLIAAGGISDEAEKAVETITLALVQGSDR